MYGSGAGFRGALRCMSLYVRLSEHSADFVRVTTLRNTVNDALLRNVRTTVWCARYKIVLFLVSLIPLKYRVLWKLKFLLMSIFFLSYGSTSKR